LQLGFDFTAPLFAAERFFLETLDHVAGVILFLISAIRTNRLQFTILAPNACRVNTQKYQLICFGFKKMVDRVRTISLMVRKWFAIARPAE
jgi:hypothetical protein